MCQTAGRDCETVQMVTDKTPALSCSTLVTLIQQQRDHYSALGEGEQKHPLPAPPLDSPRRP